ncbi:hypothetical protein EYR36_008498 [Pleurotus pulmonarius]|nr:hypothetical protein EYR36_008498 [Pleurotus pulmonarius]
MDSFDSQRGTEDAQQPTTMNVGNAAPTDVGTVPPASGHSDSRRDVIEVELPVVDDVNRANNQTPSANTIPEPLSSPSSLPSPHSNDASMLEPNQGQQPSSVGNDGGINTDDRMVLDSVEDSDVDPEMPSLEPLFPLSPSATQSNEASTPPVSGTSTPQRANRRPRVEDDEDADRDRRHPSQRTGNAHIALSLNSETTNGLTLVFYRPSLITMPGYTHVIVGGPQMQTHFGGVPFTLFGHHHNLRTGTDNNSDRNSNPQSVPGSDTTAPNDWASLAANNPNGVAITFDLLRGGPPIVRPLDASNRPPPPLNHNHPQDHNHGHTHHDHAAPPAADQNNATGQANGGNTNATPSAPRPNLRDSFAQTQELLRQVRAMTDVLTTALGALEGAGGEDRRRGRMVVRGLEEVPEGLAQRMDALKTQGDESGMGGCAICWDSLLEDAGFGGEADPQATPPSDATQTTTASQEGATADPPSGNTNQAEVPQPPAGSLPAAGLPTPPTTTAPEAEEEPLPKIVVLPCSHAFHASCLVPWFSKPMRTSCPTCRFNIDPEGMIWGVGRRREPAEGGAGPGGINLGGMAGMPFGPFALPPGFVQTMTTDQAGGPHGPQPAPAAGGPPLMLSVNGTQVPLVLVDGGNGPNANGAQRRSQSVPRRRTQSLPRDGAPQSATTDNLEAPTDNNAANAWARGRGLPQLPPGASRTVYHAHLPIGGVDVVFDVIPVDVGRAPGPNPQQPPSGQPATNEPAGDNAPDSQTHDHPHVHHHHVHTHHFHFDENFAVDMDFGSPDDFAMDLDLDLTNMPPPDAALFGAFGRNGTSDGSVPSNAPANGPEANPQAAAPVNNTNTQHTAPTNNLPPQESQPAPRAHRRPPRGMGLGLGFLQQIFGNLLPTNTPAAPNATNAANAAATSPTPASAPTNASAAPQTSRASDQRQPNGNSPRSSLGDAIMRTLGTMANHVMPGTPAANSTTPGESQGTSSASPSGASIPNELPPPQSQPQDAEQAAATGLPAGVPAQLAQAFAPAAPAPNNADTNTGNTQRPRTAIDEFVQRYEALLGPLPPLPSFDEMAREYQPLLARLAHQGQPLAEAQPGSTPSDNNTPGATATNAQAPNPTPFRSLVDLFGPPAQPAADGTTQPAGAQRDPNRPPSLLDGFPLLSGLRSRAAQRPSLSETRKWSPPPAPGATLRQRVEKKEKEAGLRCDDVSCGVGPSDEDPVVTKTMNQLSIHYLPDHLPASEVGSKVCNHTFHPSCLVSAERIASQGQNEHVEGDEVAVSCPICRHPGAISKADWDQGAEVVF